jgi:type I restriction enzyme M protein
MNTQEIVGKLWNLCNVLRDDGITYHQYVTELTYILFLKMAKETGTEDGIPEKYRWDELIKKEGTDLSKFYRQLLLDLGSEGKGKIKEIYSKAQTNIDAPANLRKIIANIDKLDWYSAREEGLGNLYEGLLEKNANEVKSGAGQYFTPRPLIDVMTELIDPQVGEKCNDPACGTFGFMIAADAHLQSKTDNYYNLTPKQATFQRNDAFSGCELVQDTHRLAMMNAMLHGLNSDITLGDTLSQLGEGIKGFNVVLTNPPFGTKKGGERPTRTDFSIATSNKQLNFLQHVYRSLIPDGKSRAAVVLPDNVLFQDGDGQKVRTDLMDKCNLHTVLRLPTGIFYAQGVKTNVLFFTKGKKDKSNTEEVWFYDMRTNMQNFGKTSPLKRSDFDAFAKAYLAKDRKKVNDERWNSFSREEIKKKNDSLDLGLIADDSLTRNEDLPEPKFLAYEALEELGAAIEGIKKLLMLLEKDEE